MREAVTGIVALPDIPHAVRRAVDRDVNASVAVEIAANRNVRREAPMHCGHAAVGAAFDLPDALAVEVAVNRRIGLAVAVIIGGDELVRCQSERKGGKAVRILRIPHTGRRPKDREIVQAVSVEVAVTRMVLKRAADLARRIIHAR